MIPASAVSHLPKQPGVYLITHNRSGDTYVGKSKSILDRCRAHRGWMNGRLCQNENILRCIREHGIDFRFDVLELVPVESLSEAESKWTIHLQPSLNRVPPKGARRQNQGRFYRQ